MKEDVKMLSRGEVLQQVSEDRNSDYFGKSFAEILHTLGDIHEARFYLTLLRKKNARHATMNNQSEREESKVSTWKLAQAI